MTEITWHIEKRKISDLKDYEHNPRTITSEQFKKLVRSIQEDGYHMRLLVNLDGTIIGGHSRKRALIQCGYNLSDEIEVLVPSRLLLGDEFDRINMRDNLLNSDWDFDMLSSNWDAEKLIDWGMPEDWLIGKEKAISVSNEKKEPKQKMCPACGEVLN